MYDLALQPPWLSDGGAAWVAGISHAGHVAVWDTETLACMNQQRAAASAIFSCCVMPGCAFCSSLRNAPCQCAFLIVFSEGRLASTGYGSAVVSAIVSGSVFCRFAVCLGLCDVLHAL